MNMQKQIATALIALAGLVAASCVLPQGATLSRRLIRQHIDRPEQLQNVQVHLIGKITFARARSAASAGVANHGFTSRRERDVERVVIGPNTPGIIVAVHFRYRWIDVAFEKGLVVRFALDDLDKPGLDTYWVRRPWPCSSCSLDEFAREREESPMPQPCKVGQPDRWGQPTCLDEDDEPCCWAMVRGEYYSFEGSKKQASLRVDVSQFEDISESERKVGGLTLDGPSRRHGSKSPGRPGR